ncbi:NAD-dependent epimerase/dehydratase family protein [Rhizobium sullae]|uniref:NAD-dependent epimerase/dehydratase family protein n=1 Tax=Rhizobium sullae TaxID=50338 RepID=UPI000B3579F5|nr:NAD(P)-dependent oxidoreductase [Rhizobium sullae]
MMKIAITGATGFIGSKLARTALSRGISVVALVRDVTRCSVPRSKSLEILPWHLGQPLPKLRDVQAVFHLAAVIPNDLSDPGAAPLCFQNNTISALQLATDAAQQRIGHIIHFSSGQVYTRSQVPAHEDSPAYPVERATYYLASKLAGELCLAAAARAGTVVATILRLGSVYGPGMHPRGMLPTFIANLVRNTPVIIDQGGVYTADFIHVDDVVELALKMIEAPFDGLLNVGSGAGRSSLEAAVILAEALGADPALITVRGVAKNAGFAPLSILRARKLFDFNPMQLEAGIAKWKASGQLANSFR